MIFGPSLLLLKIKFFVSPISAKMTRSLKCHDYKNFKNFTAMLKNFLMIVDMTNIAALSCFMLFWGIVIIFRLHLASRAAAPRKNWCMIFRNHIFNGVPKKIHRFLVVSTTEKFDCQSKIWMKYGVNLLEKYRVTLVTDHSRKFSANLNILVIKQVWS